MVGYSWESIPNGREWSRDPTRGPGVVGKPSRMTGSSRETMPEVGDGCEALPEGREWSGGPTRGPRVVGTPSILAGSGREALLWGREWSGMVVRPAQRAGSSWE